MRSVQREGDQWFGTTAWYSLLGKVTQNIDFKINLIGIIIRTTN